MGDEEVKRLVSEFLEANPGCAKGKSFHIDAEGAVHVMPELRSITGRCAVPSDALALADADDKGNVHVYSTPDVFERMYLELFNYRLGGISFLKMLDKWEEILGIKPDRTKSQGISQEGKSPL
jgi:hypothetical protein